MVLEPITAYLLLGSNLGNREVYLSDAVGLIENRIGEIEVVSSIYETAPWGKTDQPGFLNKAVAVRTHLNPIALLAAVLAIEQELGRIRLEKWGARVIDIDIILYGDQIVDEVQLQIPHREMRHRKFVMEPLAEIAAAVVHPQLGKTMQAILEDMEDPLTVEKRALK